jgi:hypothetical protein
LRGELKKPFMMPVEFAIDRQTTVAPKMLGLGREFL